MAGGQPDIDLNPFAPDQTIADSSPYPFLDMSYWRCQLISECRVFSHSTALPGKAFLSPLQKSYSEIRDSGHVLSQYSRTTLNSDQVWMRFCCFPFVVEELLMDCVQGLDLSGLHLSPAKTYPSKATRDRDVRTIFVRKYPAFVWIHMGLRMQTLYYCFTVNFTSSKNLTISSLEILPRCGRHSCTAYWLPHSTHLWTSWSSVHAIPIQMVRSVRTLHAASHGL